ncbi:hypothetical protein ANCCAN_01363 [Ancylostoma caninum]|uniref:SCP domain-containing protein n=1 Tax=Ancylostoma caninum TaxID=29170 RepID=A0A368H6S2_ANCCA|nr:hypothetical protein ANCCAN_01363 [Ancylostoma caninum]
MGASKRTIFWAVCFLSWGSNVFSLNPPKCIQMAIGDVRMSDDVRRFIYNEVSKWLPKKTGYSCYLEWAANFALVDNHSRIQGLEDYGEEVEMRRIGPWRANFLKDTIKWWAPELKNMDRLAKFGCFFFRTPSNGKTTAKLSCIFISSRD